MQEEKDEKENRMSCTNALYRRCVRRSRPGRSATTLRPARDAALPKWAFRNLLDKEGFAELIAADKRLHAAEAAEQLLDFAILIDLLRRENRLGGQNLQRAGVADAIALEAHRLLAVEHGEDDSTGAQELGDLGDHQFGKSGFEIVEDVPK